MTKFFKYNIYLFLVLISCAFSFASHIEILDYDVSEYPDISISFILAGTDSTLVTELNKSDINISDNGINLPIYDISCGSVSNSNPMSLSFAFDISSESDYLLSNSKKIAGQIIELAPQNSEYSVSAFGLNSLLFSDFTSDRELTFETIEAIDQEKSSNIDSGLFAYPAGALRLSSRSDYNRAVILFGDCIQDIDYETLYNFCAANSIRVFCISFRNNMNGGLKELALNTGRYYFENIDPQKINIYSNIINLLLGKYTPCVVRFNLIDLCAESHHIEISSNIDGSVSRAIDIEPLDISAPELLPSQAYLNFSAVKPGAIKEIELTVSSRNGDIHIDSAVIDNSVFSIISGAIPQGGITIVEDESRKLSIKFQPSDSSIVYSEMTFFTDACDNPVIGLSGGFPNKQLQKSAIKVVYPSGGEVFYQGDDIDISWKGVLPNDYIQLDYSQDNGANWTTLKQLASNLNYSWSIPDDLSDECLMKVSQYWPRTIQDTIDLKHGASVNSAMFNSYGDLIVTACKDSCVRIWNSYTAEELLCLRGHKGPVIWADFDNTGNFVISSSEDETAILWDLKTGDKLFTFQDHNDIVTSANFSADSKKIVTTSIDGKIFIYDTENGTKLREINSGQERVYHAKFSPDNKYIVSAGSNGIVKLWDAKNYSLLWEYDTGINMVVYADFCPKSQMIVATSWYDKGFVFDINLKDTLYTFRHSNENSGIRAINSAGFYYKEEQLLLVSAGIDNIRIWDALSGKLIHVYNGHSSIIMTADLNFDASRILTASWDSLAKIRNWDMKRALIQSKVSDSVFTITALNYNLEDLDIGTIFVPEHKDTLISAFLTNNGDYPFDIKRMEISGPDADDFKIIGKNIPATVSPGATYPLEILFEPKTPGKKMAGIDLVLPGKTVSASLAGTAALNPLISNPSVVDFGDVHFGTFKDSLLISAIKNTGDDKIEISSIKLDKPDTSHFKIISGDGAVSLNPGETRELKIRYIPESTRLTNACVAIKNQSIDKTSKISLFGRGATEPRDTFLLSIDKALSGRPGEILNVNLYLSGGGSEYSAKDLKGIYFDLTFNASILDPLDDYEKSVEKYGLRTVTYYQPITQDDENSLAELRFRIGLGDNLNSPLEISNSYQEAPVNVAINEESGTFTLFGVCRDGGERLFDSSGRLYLNDVSPNPSASTINIHFGIIEPGFATIIIYNLSGQKVLTAIDKYLSPGTYSIEANIEELSPGIYWMKLETPSDRIVKRVIVNR